MRNSILLCGLLLLCSLSAKTQVPIDNNPAENDLIEVLVEEQEDSEFGYDTYMEQFETYLRNPLALNKADYNELRNSGLLSELQIRDLLNHIALFGDLTSIYELQTIPSFSSEDIRRIKPYVSAGGEYGKTTWAQMMSNGQYALFLRSTRVLESQAGYRADSTVSNPYLGNPYRLYTRFRYQYKTQLSYGFTAEKDPGEPFSKPAGFDYISAHYFQRGNKFVRAVALGDYEVRIGQGLVAWSGFGLGKSIYPVNVKRSGGTLAPYSSVDENRFYRGAAISVGKGNWEYTLFGSYNQVDANRIEITDSLDIEDGTDEDFVSISSLQLSGLHRTESEIFDKDAVGIAAAGTQLLYRHKGLSIAAAAVYHRINADLQEDKSPYELYDFSGSELLNGSISYSMFAGNMLLFGETAISDNGKIATINSLVIPVDRHVDIALVQRYYDPGFLSFFSQSFSENTFPRNEKGFYAGIEVSPSRPWKLNGYIDVYESPWLEFSTDAPGYGVDYLSTLYYKPNRNFETYIRLRHEISDRNASADFQEDEPQDIITDEAKTRIRWNISYKITREITLRNRVEYSRYDEGFGFPESGYLLYQDVVYKPWEQPFSLAGRYTIFRTDTYDTRIYAFENDILYAYSIANLFGSGQRYYVVAQYSPSRWMDTWIKLVRTTYSDRDEIGSANEVIEGNNRTELRLQVRFKW